MLYTSSMLEFLGLAQLIKTATDALVNRKAEDFMSNIGSLMLRDSEVKKLLVESA